MKTITQNFKTLFIALLFIQLCCGYTFAVLNDFCDCEYSHCCSCNPTECTDDTSDSDATDHHGCNCTPLPEKADRTPSAVSVSSRNYVTFNFFLTETTISTINFSNVIAKKFAPNHTLAGSPPDNRSMVLRI